VSGAAASIALCLSENQGAPTTCVSFPDPNLIINFCNIFVSLVCIIFLHNVLFVREAPTVHKVLSEPFRYFAIHTCAQIFYGFVTKIQKALRIITLFKVSRFRRPNPHPFFPDKFGPTLCMPNNVIGSFSPKKSFNCSL
jgi:hypothetical protein